jgi:methionine synthase II (cobalamin-independent)
LKHLFKLNAGYFQLQLASERDRESAYKLVGKHLRGDANGVPQMAYIGVIVTQSPRPESAQEVCDQLVAAAKYIDKQVLGSTDDCGFSPFSIDMKPNHGTPDYARDVAFQKIANRVAGTKMAAEKLGVH